MIFIAASFIPCSASDLLNNCVYFIRRVTALYHCTILKLKTPEGDIILVALAGRSATNLYPCYSNTKARSRVFAKKLCIHCNLIKVCVFNQNSSNYCFSVNMSGFIVLKWTCKVLKTFYNTTHFFTLGKIYYWFQAVGHALTTLW